MPEDIYKIIAALENSLKVLKKEAESQKKITTPLFSKLITDIEKHEAMYKCWKKWHHFGKKRIGRYYERYVGYLYFVKGYTVLYPGIVGKNKLKGIDLVAENEKEVVLIQCKCHKSNTVFHYDVIDKLRGSLEAYKIQNPKKRNVRGVFHTSAIVADEAKKEAKALQIEIVEKVPFTSEYPQIKCNISLNGTKRYFLPWLCNYDKVIIEPLKGEFYADSVIEAIDLGFMRAKSPVPNSIHFWDFWRYCRKEG